MANALTTVQKSDYENNNERVEEYIFTFLGDDGTGAIDSKATVAEVIGWVFMIETNPGGTAPTANYDITITNDAGADILGGVAADRSATVTERETPKIGTAYGESWVNSVLTFNSTNNSVNSAVGVVKIWVRKAHRGR